MIIRSIWMVEAIDQFCLDPNNFWLKISGISRSLISDFMLRKTSFAINAYPGSSSTRVRLILECERTVGTTKQASKGKLNPQPRTRRVIPVTAKPAFSRGLGSCTSYHLWRHYSTYPHHHELFIQASRLLAGQIRPTNREHCYLHSRHSWRATDAERLKRSYIWMTSLLVQPMWLHAAL